MAFSRKSRSQLDSGVSFILPVLTRPLERFQSRCSPLEKACGNHRDVLNSTPEVDTTFQSKGCGKAFLLFYYFTSELFLKLIFRSFIWVCVIMIQILVASVMPMKHFKYNVSFYFERQLRSESAPSVNSLFWGFKKKVVHIYSKRLARIRG